MSNLIKFVLVGPNKGKTIGFSKDHKGDPRYKFKNGVMEVHASRVNGKFISFMAKTYSAHVDGNAPGEENGLSDVSEDGNNAVGSEKVSSELSEAQSSPAAESAIELKGSGKSKAGGKK